MFIAYGVCLILVGLSIFLTIARGIEFGDLKTQQWFTSILSGLLSSILLTQPLKVKRIFSPSFDGIVFDYRFYPWRYSLHSSVKN